MSGRSPKTIFTDQDAAMEKALSFVMPGTCQLLYTWHFMQNAVKHLSGVLRGSVDLKTMLGKFMDFYEEEDEFIKAWNDMLSKYNFHENTWLRSMFELRRKWANAYVKWEWSVGMRSTQVSESFNVSLKCYLKSNHNLPEFFKYFESIVKDKRHKKLEAEYALCNKLPKRMIKAKMLVQAGSIYTKAIFEKFHNQFEEPIEAYINGCIEDGGFHMYTVLVEDQSRKRQVKRSSNAEVDRLYKVALNYAQELRKVVHNIRKVEFSSDNHEQGDLHSFTNWDTNKVGHGMDIKNDINAKGLKRRESSKGRRRFISPIEKALQKKRKSSNR
ncbi:protein FAR-RED IMPAIRED RESPONSE 1-like [Cornus florida]|uniref:protein FAR-RED IMPAIRED RESPONSE 1-like n=1 Tax=Cornus florida TaxID=4283 RepID=UPI002898EF0A|nr:protein FAR-RED IMPAIRED RESPONSE 1-like [Cornus florida]